MTRVVKRSSPVSNAISPTALLHGKYGINAKPSKARLADPWSLRSFNLVRCKNVRVGMLSVVTLGGPTSSPRVGQPAVDFRRLWGGKGGMAGGAGYPNLCRA